jgi:hypothetical protein
MASAVTQTVVREPTPPATTFVDAVKTREYLAFASDVPIGSGVAVFVTCADFSTIGTCSDSAGNTVGAVRESQINSSNSDNSLFAYITTAIIRRGVVGVATAGSDATHLEDTSKSWVTNEWAGITLLDYNGNTRTVVSNTATELVVSSGTTIVSGDGYVLGGWIRVDTSASAFYEGIVASVFSGVSSIVDTSHAYPTAVAAGTDNISSGSKALGSAPVGIWSVCYDDTNTGTSAPAASSRSGTTDLGTGFTWDTGQTNARFQFRNVANPGTLDATFSSISSNNYNTFMVAFLDGAGVPTITAQPTQQTASVGSTATFSVTATASAGSLSYQWKLNGGNITGATGSTYTTGALTAGDNGGLYSCAVTDSNGTTNTLGARLFLRDIHVGIGRFPFVGWYRRMDCWRTNTFAMIRKRLP